MTDEQSQPEVTETSATPDVSSAPATPHQPTEEATPVGDPAATYLANTGDGEIRATVMAVLTRRFSERIRRAIASDIAAGRGDRLLGEPLREVELRAESLADRLWSSK